VSVRVGGSFNLIGEPAFAYLCFWVAVHKRLPKLDRYGDFSYGVYIYAFLVEQMASMYGVNHWGFLPYVVVCLAVSMLFAVASWFAVERTFLKLKSVPFPSLLHAPAWWSVKVQGRPAAAHPRSNSREVRAEPYEQRQP
jgi:peptidoglycan/LPS O-acetylase OafA/YrhL